MKSWLLLFALTPWIPSLALAGDSWPAFRGPDGLGVSTARGLPVTWSETENIAWKTALPGRGWSSPVVADGCIWVTAATDEGQSLRALCIALDTGELTHNVEVIRLDKPPAINVKNSYASPTPVLEPGRVYVHFGAFGTGCLDAQTAQVLWTNRELIVDHKEGPGSSPVLWNDLLIAPFDGMDQQFVAAFDKRTGIVRWRTDRTGAKNPVNDFRKAYCTPLLADWHGTPVAIIPGADRANAYDPQTGDDVWHLDYRGFSNVPRPVAAHGLVFICSGYMQPQLLAVRPPAARGETPEVVWKSSKNVPANPSPVVVGGELYMVNDMGVASCLDAQTGEPHWTTRLGGNYSASPLSADGRLYFTSEAGVTTVIEPGLTFKKLATNSLSGRVQASLAPVEGGLLLRTETDLYHIR